MFIFFARPKKTNQKKRRPVGRNFCCAEPSSKLRVTSFLNLGAFELYSYDRGLRRCCNIVFIEKQVRETAGESTEQLQEYTERLPVYIEWMALYTERLPVYTERLPVYIEMMALYTEQLLVYIECMTLYWE